MMGYCIRVPNGIVSMAYTEFKCPKCECPHDEEHYYKRLCKKDFVYISCRGCKTKIGVAIDIMGDVHAWLKEE